MAGATEYIDFIDSVGKNSPSNKCLRYTTKQSDREAPALLDFRWMQSTILLPSLPGELWLGVVASDRVRSMGWMELFGIETDCKQMTYAKLNC